MRKRIAMPLLVCLSLQGAGTALAVGLPWQNHASPFNFVFGNPIDMHQQPKPVGNTALVGFVHVKFTGKVVEAIPEAAHAGACASECVPSGNGGPAIGYARQISI